MCEFLKVIGVNYKLYLHTAARESARETMSGDRETIHRRRLMNRNFLRVLQLGAVLGKGDFLSGKP